jgi:preprotein translocase subunit SecA
MSIFSKLFGDKHTRYVSKIQPIVSRINEYEESFVHFSEKAFIEKTQEFKGRIGSGETLDSLLPEAFALVREAAKQALSQRHYDVQMLGGIVLNTRAIAEMRTGEGKTLVATLPAYLNALEGKGVHVVTVNDYLARRDAVWMGHIFSRLGLSIGVINDLNQSFLFDPLHVSETQTEKDTEAFKVKYEHLRPCTRREAYAADITYGTNSQFGFDYLRDNLATNVTQVVQRGHHYALVDEIDSILIDEARTPLIISSAAAESDELYKTFAHLAKSLARDVDYIVDEKLRAATLTDTGITKAEQTLGLENIYTEKGIKYVHHLETAVKAEALFEREKEYVVKDGEIVIVDAFTGRLQPGRRYSEGVHQAIEAKEGVKIQAESKTSASITYQNYFRMYKKLSGMTGTAETSSEEFFKVYGLDVIAIPTHRPIARIDHNDYIFQTEKGKWRAIAHKVKELQEKGQPVLIGTVSIARNELLSAYLTEEGVRHQVLNAKNHEQEGEVTAVAGKKSAVTIATNMAGRGVDIKLGGPSATKEEQEKVKALGGLFVLGTERHEARRIDNQLRGRAGRQGDPGETQFFVSMEDDLMRVFGSERMKSLMGTLGIPEDQPIENGMITRSLESAQTKIEGFHFDGRKHTLEYDDVLNHQRASIYNRRREFLFGNRSEIDSAVVKIADTTPGFLDIITQKRSELKDDLFYESLRRILLYTNDILWMEHIDTMDYLRSSINLRAYGQREPLVEYKKEALRLFKDMEASFTEQVAGLVGTLAVTQDQMKAEIPKELPLVEGNGVETPAMPTVGRNDPCPCGSGKKFKKCHGLNQ